VAVPDLWTGPGTDPLIESDHANSDCALLELKLERDFAVR